MHKIKRWKTFSHISLKIPHKTWTVEITIYGHCSAIGPEISLRILVGVTKPAGGIKVCIELFISFQSSQLQILVHFLNNLVECPEVQAGGLKALCAY